MKLLRSFILLLSTASISFPIDLDLKLRLQPRLDVGDIYKDSGKFENRSDLYMRRARLEVSKKLSRVPVGKSLKAKIVLSADKIDRDYNFRSGKKKRRDTDVRLKYAYLKWKFRDEISVLFGKKKKPYSRIALTSSSRQLLIERPFFIEDAKDWLGDYDGLQLMVEGSFVKGIVRYMFAVSDGSSIEEKQEAGENVRSEVSFGNFYALRIEFSPPGFVEKKKDDTGVGEKSEGNVVSLGLSYAKNGNFDVDTDDDVDNGYEVKNESGEIFGMDLFGRFGLGVGVLTFQLEYALMRYRKVDREESGWYAQTGYLVDALMGEVEPAFRYEFQNIKYEGRKREVLTLGFNHYLDKHRLKWSYNVLFINNRWSGGDDQTVHQLQAQLYF